MKKHFSFFHVPRRAGVGDYLENTLKPAFKLAISPSKPIDGKTMPEWVSHRFPQGFYLS